MITITYGNMFLVLSVVWCMMRASVWIKRGCIDGKRELQLLPVYLYLAILVRFIFCPFGRVNGNIQPLLLDPNRVFPLRVNLVPLVYLLDYDLAGEAALNVMGNILLFLPLGVILPTLWKKRSSHWKMIAAGVAVSLTIEILQLPFFERVSDVDDLIFNTFGYLLGYLLYFGGKCIRPKRTSENEG